MENCKFCGTRLGYISPIGGGFKVYPCHLKDFCLTCSELMADDAIRSQGFSIEEIDAAKETERLLDAERQARVTTQ